MQLLSHHAVRPMYDATNQENTSLTRTVSALPVIIGRGVGNDGQHMSGGLAAPIYATSIGDRLPGFVFDEVSFHGHRPASTWEWFSSSKMSGGQYRAGTEWGNGEIRVLVFDHTACDIVT